MRSSLIAGQVMHTRQTPVKNAFVYPALYLLVDVDELPALDRELPLFGYNRPAPVAFHDADHMGDPQLSVRENLLRFLQDNGIEPPEGRIMLLTIPRIFGYVFIPVSFFYCYDSDDRLALIVAEVNNTWGERHSYILSGENAIPSGKSDEAAYAADKAFYVSPFIDMEARYEFAFSPLEEGVYVHINEFQDGEKFFAARLWGDRAPLTNKALSSALLRFPFSTVMVVARIVWQAFKLWMRRVPIVPKVDKENKPQLHEKLQEPG